MNEYIDKVIERLRAGWCQGAYFKDTNDIMIPLASNQIYDKGINCCLGGAVMIIPDPERNNEILFNRFHAKYKTTFVNFNDKPGRTVEEVVTALEACKD